MQLVDIEKFANIAMPKIFGTEGEENMLNFYGINCLAVRNDLIEPDFLQDIYKCYEWDDGKSQTNTKNYKYKKGTPSILPLLVLKLFSFLRMPARLQLYKREIKIEEDIEFATTLDLSPYKTCLNSDLTILIGVSLLKNTRIQNLLLINLNLYDIDIQTLASNVASLHDLRKLSFKRSTFMDKVKSLDKLLVSTSVPSLNELNLNMTNILSMLQAP
jgi:hypothetical protein